MADKMLMCFPFSKSFNVKVLHYISLKAFHGTKIGLFVEPFAKLHLGRNSFFWPHFENFVNRLPSGVCQFTNFSNWGQNLRISSSKASFAKGSSDLKKRNYRKQLLFFVHNVSLHYLGVPEMHLLLHVL